MHKMLFCTGVTLENNRYKGGKLIEMPFYVWKGGVKHIEYFLAAPPPEGARVLWLCDSPDVKPGQLAIPIISGGMLSKFAIFALKGVAP